ncbi:MAG TPA: universal stress protein, partial [Anaerolineales bacterium]
MFDHILVPLDGSTLAECVLPHLLAIAKTGNPRITLLSVLDPFGAANRSKTVDPFDWQVRKAETEAYLKDQAARLSEANLTIQVEILEGKAAESIVEYGRDQKVSLILLSSHGQSGISGWNVSSVVQKIILRAHTSVMIVRAYQPAPAGLAGMHYQRILLPLDGSQRAEIVLPVAEALARAHDATLLLAHVVRRPELPCRTP